MKEDIKEVLGKLGKVLESGEREDQLWFNIDTETPLTKEDYSAIEAALKRDGMHAEVINASAALSRSAVKEVQRIWLVAFDSAKKLKEWRADFEARQKQDHRYIGEQLDWFHVQEDLIGPGLPLLHPKGMVIKLGLKGLMRDVNRDLGAQEVWTPHIAKADLWKRSGHYDHYRDKMFVWKQDDQEWGIKAMNCPMHIQIYRHQPRSYRDLPIRYAEFATDYRKEQSGELHGLSRVWSLTQDDHHFICQPDQLAKEVERVVAAARGVYDLFGFDYKLKLATRPNDSMGSDKLWKKSESALREALDRLNVEYEVEEGDGAFYGPKIDLYVRDNMDRWWQLTTVQLDFFMPERFSMTYVSEDNSLKTPVILHFAILGSFERFMSVLIEHYEGRLPFWLAPDQVRVLPIGEDHETRARAITEDLRAAGIRAGVDCDGTLGKRIRRAELEKVATIAVLGDRELEDGSINVRGEGTIPLVKFKERALTAVRERTGF